MSLAAAAAILTSATGAGVSQMKPVAREVHWVTTWGCGPQLTEPRNLPPVPLADRSLRQFVPVSVGGNHLRVRFSNAFGTDPVTIRSAHVALATGAGSGNGGSINRATDRALAFGGAPAVTIPAGETVFSDALNYPLPALTNLAITIYFGDISTATVSGHPGSRTTSFIAAGDAVSAASMAGAASTAHWYLISGVDVLKDTSGKSLVVFGDSITDGRGSTTDGNNRWPDALAHRLHTNAVTAGVAVVNMGIGANGIFGGAGPSGLRRFDRDVLQQSGVRWLMVFEGVNDIGGDFSGQVGTNLIAAYTQFIGKAHAHHIRAYGATITPFGGNNYYTTSHEAARQAVNTWMRTNRLGDGVIDFDAAVRDPATPKNLRPAYDTGDHLHLNPAGYQAMADAVDLRLFTR